MEPTQSSSDVQPAPPVSPEEQSPTVETPPAPAAAKKPVPAHTSNSVQHLVTTVIIVTITLAALIIFAYFQTAK